MSSNFSAEYIQLRQRGAFAGRIDPFAEEARYFHAIHSGMIEALLDAMQDTLTAMGYQANRERSAQIVKKNPWDKYSFDTSPEKTYEALAATLNINPGTAVHEVELILDAIHITQQRTGDLVTVVEIVSPQNKFDLQNTIVYRRQRTSFLKHGVNVVEIDSTRSIWRSLAHRMTIEHPYHIAVHLTNDNPHVMIIDFLQPLPPFALPLIGEGIRVEPQQAYDHAYQRGAIAGLILQEGQYTRDALPFPSTLTETQIEEALQAVNTWQAELQRLAGT